MVRRICYEFFHGLLLDLVRLMNIDPAVGVRIQVYSMVKRPCAVERGPL